MTPRNLPARAYWLCSGGLPPTRTELDAFYSNSLVRPAEIVRIATALMLTTNVLMKTCRTRLRD